MSYKLSSQRGGASLLVTVVFAVLLLGIVGGLTSLSVRELRQASNTEQSNRALVAAESQVDVLANSVTANGVVPADNASSQCNAAQQKDVGDNLQITCATVEIGASEEIEGTLERDRSFRIDLSKAYKKTDTNKQPVPIAFGSIEWGNSSYSNELLPTPTASSFDDYPPLKEPNSNWKYQAAPELTYVWWNPAGVVPINAADGSFGLPIKKTMILPGINGTGEQIGSICSNAATEYTCKTTSSNSNPGYNIGATTGGAQGFVLKLTARYNGMNFRMKFYDAGGNLLTVPLPYATIDVTARANNLYRRVVAQKTLNPSSAFSFLDGNVLFTPMNICKDLRVGQNHDFVTGADGKNTASCENPPAN